MELTKNGIELVIDHPKWLKLMQDGLVDARDALMRLYGVQFVPQGYDVRRGIEFSTVIVNGKRVGNAFITTAESIALERGETVKIWFAL